MKRKKIVVPGEEIGTCEEFIPGDGTYEEDGKIFASTLGTLYLDLEEMIARVTPANPPVTLDVDDIVIASVIDRSDSMVFVDVAKVEGKEREISSETYGSIHVSKISNGYTSNIQREYRIGDIIRARVTQTKPSLQLSTNQAHLGVLRALCTRCRKPLRKRGMELFCENCETLETRKIASDYGVIEPR